jgi:hypothetical protein
MINMNFSAQLFTRTTRTGLLFALAAVVAITSVFGASTGIAQAQKRKKLTAPIVQVTKVRPDAAELTITNVLSTIGARQEYQVISGPNAAGSPSSLTIATVLVVGTRNILGSYPIQLLPNSDYVVRVRNIKTSADFSDWVNVSFRTTAQFDARPSSPPNLRITQQTATQVTLMWDAPGGAAPFTYEMFLNGVRTALLQCGGAYVTCTEADFRTVTINRPAVGSTLTFGVAARDANLNLSLPAELTLTN